jgi:hypothetical protein
MGYKRANSADRSGYLLELSTSVRQAAGAGLRNSAMYVRIARENDASGYGSSGRLPCRKIRSGQ